MFPARSLEESRFGVARGDGALLRFPGNRASRPSLPRFRRARCRRRCGSRRQSRSHTRSAGGKPILQYSRRSPGKRKRQLQSLDDFRVGWSQPQISAGRGPEQRWQSRCPDSKRMQRDPLFERRPERTDEKWRWHLRLPTGPFYDSGAFGPNSVTIAGVNRDRELDVAVKNCGPDATNGCGGPEPGHWNVHAKRNQLEPGGVVLVRCRLHDDQRCLGCGGERGSLT